MTLPFDLSGLVGHPVRYEAFNFSLIREICRTVHRECREESMNSVDNRTR